MLNQTKPHPGKGGNDTWGRGHDGIQDLGTGNGQLWYTWLTQLQLRDHRALFPLTLYFHLKGEGHSLCLIFQNGVHSKTETFHPSGKLFMEEGKQLKVAPGRP